MSSPETKMVDVDYCVRTMSKEDVAQAVEMWMEDKLYLNIQNVYTWHLVDPEGFKAAVTDSGEVLGAGCAVVHHEDLAFVGMFFVKKKYRGKGIGPKIWNACLTHIEARNAATNSVLHKKELFRIRGRFPILETVWECMMNITANPIHHETLTNIPPRGVDILPFQETYLKSMFDFDYTLIGYKRELVLELSCKQKHSKTMVAFKDNSCVGFGIIELYGACICKVGPLYADDPVVAEVLLRRLIVSFPQMKRFVMITLSNNVSANNFVKRIGCEVVAKFSRHYTREKIDVDVGKVFAMIDGHFSPY